jgi:tetratricopeptide (TPR) repeat protein
LKRFAWLLLPLVAGATEPPTFDSLHAQCLDGEAAACRQAMRLQGDDAELASTAGDVFMQARRPTEAILAYRRSQRLGFPDEESLRARMAGAEAKRQTLLVACETGLDDAARRACDAALLPGAADEARILQRRGSVQAALHRDSEALDDFLAAQRFNPQDQELAQAVVRQADATGRHDVAALVGRGTALLALRRAAEAVAPLRQALALEPGSRTLRAMLQGAEAEQPAATLESTQFPAHGEQRFSNAAEASFSH